MFKDELPKTFDRKNIIDDPETLNQFSEDISLTPPSMPVLAVRPENGEDVQTLVKLADKHHAPLVPVSSGPPRFHGDTIPGKGGVIVDFSQMKRIREIDSVSRCAMVEPGVTYGALIPELKRHGLRLNVPLLPRESKSIVTSCLEREPRLIPKYQYDYVDPLLTLEAVYGTGEVFRTGSASGPGTLETLKADKVNPWGPGSVDYFRFLSGAQGTMGLVTWAVIKTEVLPSLQKLYFIPVEDPDKLTAPVNVLLKKRVVDECLVLNHVTLATILAESWPQDFEDLKTTLPPWTVLACVAGYKRRPEERISLYEKFLIDICNGLGLETHTTLPGAGIHGDRMLEVLSSPWTRKPYWKLRLKGACHDIFFLTTPSQVSKFIAMMKRTVSEYGYPIDDIGVYIQPMVQGRGCHCEFSLPCDASNPREAAEVKKIFLEASETLMNQGAFFSRPYGPWAHMVYRRYEEGVTALKKLKHIFDPNNILNPGKLCF